MSSSVKEWAETPLSRLIEPLQTGSRPRGGVRSSTTGVPSIGGEHLTSSGTFNFTNTKYVPQDFFDSMRRGRIKPGDVLVVKDGATTGKVALVRDDFPFDRAVVNEHVFICRPLDAVDPEYLFWFLYSPEGQRRILEHFQGSAQGGINQTFAPGTHVPLAPRDEQRAIARVLNSADRSGRSAIAHFVAARRAIERFRQAVRAGAVSGRLTEDWRDLNPNLERRDDPVEAARQRRRDQLGRRFREPEANPHANGPEVPASWGYATLGLLLEGIKYGTSKRSDYDSTGVPVLRIPNVSGERLDITDLKRAELDDKEAESLRLREGDLLMIRSNGSVQLVGKTGLVTGEAVGMTYAGYLMRLRADPEVLVPEYLSIALSSFSVRNQIELPARSTSGVHNINTDEVRGLVIPLPPIPEQGEIISRVEELLRAADLVDARIVACSRKIDRTSQAVLAKAFRGDLAASERTP